MDNNRDEQWQDLLNGDREIVRQFAFEVDDDKLAEAIRRGLESGKKRMQPRRRWRRMTGTGTALLFLMLIFTVTVKVSPVFADAMRQIPGLSVFVNMLKSDPAVTMAIDKSLIQPVGKTVEKDGVQLTVEGIVADEQRLIVLYSSNITGSWGNTRLLFHFFDDKNEKIEGTVAFDHASVGKTAIESRGGHDFVDLQLYNQARLPERVRMEAMVNDTKLEVDIPIDHARFEGMKQEIAINETIEIDGDRITFESAQITPLRLQLKVRSDDGSTNRLKGFIGMRIEDEKGRAWQEKSSYGLSEKEKVYDFYSNYFYKPRKLTIKADGIYRFAKASKIVVNTETMTIAEAPDERLSLKSVDTEERYRLLSFQIRGLDDVEQKFVSYSLVGATFADGAGKTHKLAEVRNFTSGSMDSRYPNERNLYVPVPNEEYPQPLTFTVEDYPGYAKQPIELELQLK